MSPLLSSPYPQFLIIFTALQLAECGLQDYFRELLTSVALYQKYYPEPVAEIQEHQANIELDFLQEDLPKVLHSIQIGTKRIQQIVLSLRNFSRMNEADCKDIDIHEGLDSTLLILQHRLIAKSSYPEIKVTKNYGDLPLIECYGGLLNQVFMNILSNAIDASRDMQRQYLEQNKTGDRLQITVQTSLLNSKYV